MRNRASVFDPASQADIGVFTDLTTSIVRPMERLDFWRHTVLRRNELSTTPDAHDLRARLRRVVLGDVELIEHSAGPLTARSLRRPAYFDGGDDIAIEFAREGAGGMIDHNGEHKLGVGDMYVVDYARPLEARRPHHRVAGLVLSRRRVLEVLGEDLTALAGQSLVATGLAAALRRHMAKTLDDAGVMTRAKRRLAVEGAAEMGLAVLQTAYSGRADPERFGEAFYSAACGLIEGQCCSPDLSPDRVAHALGCSRASLYRLFETRGESVSSVIWRARLARARKLLIVGQAAKLAIGEVATLCGFTDQATFSRMFRREFDVTPAELRRVNAWRPRPSPRLACRRSTPVPSS